jgi:tetratricopeptide (TPR) repeat protein
MGISKTLHTKSVLGIESAEATPDKKIWIVLPVVLFLLFSCASTQKEKSESENAEFYNNRGMVNDKEGLYDQAISDYNKALEINPKYAEAYSNRGVVYRRKGQYDRAISDYNKALEINPRDAEAYNNRGVAYSNKGQYDRAISDYSQAVEINQRFAGAYYGRGICYYYQKQYDKSWEDINKAQGLGLIIPPQFLDDLRGASGREK